MTPKPLNVRRWKSPRLPKGLKKEEAARIIAKMRERLNSPFNDEGIVNEARRCLNLYPYKYYERKPVPSETTRGMEHYLLFNYAKKAGFSERQLGILQSAAKLEGKSDERGQKKFIKGIKGREVRPLVEKLFQLQRAIELGAQRVREIKIPDREIEELANIIVAGNRRAFDFTDRLLRNLYDYPPFALK